MGKAKRKASSKRSSSYSSTELASVSSSNSEVDVGTMLALAAGGILLFVIVYTLLNDDKKGTGTDKPSKTTSQPTA